MRGSRRRTTVRHVCDARAVRDRIARARVGHDAADIFVRHDDVALGVRPHGIYRNDVVDRSGARMYVVFLTNRVNPTRENTAIQQIRPALHDAVMSALA